MLACLRVMTISEIMGEVVASKISTCPEGSSQSPAEQLTLTSSTLPLTVIVSPNVPVVGTALNADMNETPLLSPSSAPAGRLPDA